MENERNDAGTNAVDSDVVFGVLLSVSSNPYRTAKRRKLTSIASLFVSEMTAALDAQYAAGISSALIPSAT